MFDKTKFNHTILTVGAMICTASGLSGCNGYLEKEHMVQDKVCRVAEIINGEQVFPVSVDSSFFLNKETSNLSTTAQTALNKWAHCLNRYPQYSILVKGLTNKSGTRQYTLGSEARRLNASRDYLAILGVHTSRIRLRL